MAHLHRIFQFLCLVGLSAAIPAVGRRGALGRAIPPKPRFRGVFNDNYNHKKIAAQLRSWTPEDEQNAWELSGLHQGDIMVHPEKLARHGIRDGSARWPGAVVPYFIEANEFYRGQVEIIERGIEEINEKTCVRFRPYEQGDKDYVIIKGSGAGCWSLVGRQSRGQVVNLQTSGCVYHGTVVHELMHALGFFHQQSAADRDEWVAIHWENIIDGMHGNFEKYDRGTVTDYGIGYDYKSIMHYVSDAFSKNGRPTITPKKGNVRLGQNEGLSKKDISKINAMYKEECEGRGPETDGSDEGYDPLPWWFF